MRIGFLDKRLTGGVFVISLRHDRLDSSGVHIRRQTIRTEQQTIAVLAAIGADIGLDWMVLPKRLQNNVPVGMPGYLTLTEGTAFLQILDHGLIFRQGYKLPITPQIGPAVPDLANDQLAIGGDMQGGER